MNQHEQYVSKNEKEGLSIGQKEAGGKRQKKQVQSVCWY